MTDIASHFTDARGLLGYALTLGLPQPEPAPWRLSFKSGSRGRLSSLAAPTRSRALTTASAILPA